MYANTGTIKIFVYSRPSVDKFCAYDVRPTDTLASISDSLGMHWLTLFMLNNHTLRHPDSLPPGRRLSIGRPYVVKSGDSLYAIATRFGTTWQHIMTTNAGTLLDQQSLYQGQLLCVAPDLAFIACRGR
jgi:LysM repeat protein